ncbi:Stealth CR1 domain-containing protein [Lactiplantibacillus pentosus]|uniref:Stealth CR1 domain-containing protein n=1 Tax=Lactiplantibacillus pentosus TaxID=1589 RepID=UPI00133097FF|nr:Stealth CR1 domain-containing protein [Lactiplantibacillus pentosus]MBQ0838067.1 Stealth CR1 domain-containing protein [Lactiplantibacillus pentosus]MBU7465863.1 Stealth CR1 domain-containing protein [Lactiplantibacillus pentosus]MBU7491713.1 Stealth CR1 domain-containing protein [Lactiplantibacillus pentosus]MBU7494746.1 Stealth CR1 domain-containing protein [Lactiplantibacillus pentosus]MBU7520746.1 Stealth CR1 domain-containing protein [Lactiplantibacillus pentosus]
MNVGFPIDFVVTWVNSNDVVWQQKKAKYEIGENESRKNDEIAENRYRDFGLFKYWFRSIEQNASWVHKIYIVTDHQVPDFLNLDNSKIEIIDHSEIIDKQFLPTFDSNTIDWNLFKIPGLSEHFVYFNDDFFINQPVQPEDFFSKDGKARDTVGQSIIMPIEGYDHTLVNNTMKINQLVNKREVLKRGWKQFFSFKQGLPVLLLNVFLSVFPRFTRLYDAHTAYSFIKSDMAAAYHQLEPELLENFSEKFRTSDDYSIQFVRYYQIILGHVDVRSMYFGQTANTDNPEKAGQLLFGHKKAKITNVNDTIDATDCDLQKIIGLFNRRFPNTSGFERVRE